jgi:transposase
MDFTTTSGKDLLPGKLGDVGATARDNRRFVEAVLYRYCVGIPWRDLPERFGDWENTHWRFGPLGQSRHMGAGLRAPGRRWQ